MKTTREQLETVQQAIEMLISGAESYSIDGVSYKRTSLPLLEAREARLQKRLDREEGRIARVSGARFSREG